MRADVPGIERSRLGGEHPVADLSTLLVLLALCFAYLATYW